MQDGTNNAGKLDSGTGVRILQFLNGKFSAHGNIRTPTPRSYVATGGAGHYYLMIGGFTDFDPANYWNFFLNTPSNLVDVIYLKQIDKTVAGPNLDVARGHICAVTLGDGRVLVTGGRGGQTAIGSMASVGGFTNNGNSDPALAFGYTKLDDLADARYFHTCTVLLDGTVLVTGGVKEKGASFDALNSMEIFVPRPAAD